MSFSPLSSDTLDKFQTTEREDLEGFQRAVYHCFEMQFWHRELHQTVRQTMGQAVNIQSEGEMETQLEQSTQRLHHTAFELLRHTVLLGDELEVTHREWPEAPVDQAAWHRKVRQLMAHVSCGDDCPVPKVCESLGGMVYLARHTLTMGGEQSFHDTLSYHLEDDHGGEA